MAADRRAGLDALLDKIADDDDRALLASDAVRTALVAQDLFSAKMIGRMSYQQLVNMGLTGGVAQALKDNFPGAEQGGGGTGGGGGATAVVHVLRARVLESKRIKGVRARLYKEAVAHAAHYICIQGSEESTPAFAYEGEDLVVTLGFKLEQDAVSMETWLLQADDPASSSWFMHKRVPSTSVESTGNVTLQGRVIRAHYLPAEFESPAETYDDLARDGGTATSSSAQGVAISSTLALYQSIEKQVLLDRDGVEKAHIVPRGESKRRKIDTANNLLALSRGLHGAYDGPTGGVPRIAIRRYEREPFQPCDEAPGRQRVHVAVECADKAYEDSVMAQLKDGARRETEAQSGATMFVVSVRVEDPDLFCSNLAYKYAMTKSLWQT